ncbi:MAG: hypothetical protein GX589_05815 [Deltaproteobacteria bacterium]|nr:hypothetical protein [Deltaproteobacteria bacterium]
MALIGVDTTFLVQLELSALDVSVAARRLLGRVLQEGAELGIAFQVLSEFMHIVTDTKRFTFPLDMSQAVDRAKYWWEAREVRQIIPSVSECALTFKWLEKYGLGRKRLLDTQLAVAYHCAGIVTIISSNERDFEIFKCFKVISPADQ